MLSVLIPTYNYNIAPLVNTIHQQLSNTGLAFEILYLEDGSSQEFIALNSNITKLPHTKQYVYNSNRGRAKTRYELCKKAQYPWLLLLDADVIPKSPDFITHYLEKLNANYDAIYGGFAYLKEPPDTSHLLRWKYGKQKEAIDASIRNKSPYKIIISANFMIKASIFKTIISKVPYSGYGTDLYLGMLLKKENLNVLHINNEVYHLGIEKSEHYLTKKEQAVSLLLNLYREGKTPTHSNHLLTWFIYLKRFGGHFILSLFFKGFKQKMKNNLLGKKPSVWIFQLYKMSYMCYLDLNK